MSVFVSLRHKAKGLELVQLCTKDLSFTAMAFSYMHLRVKNIDKYCQKWTHTETQIWLFNTLCGRLDFPVVLAVWSLSIMNAYYDYDKSYRKIYYDPIKDCVSHVIVLV